MTDWEKEIVAMVRSIVQRRKEEIGEIRVEQNLVGELGLGSMDLAELVATLEMKLDVDPFAEDVSIGSVRTVRDLLEAYRVLLG